MNIKDLVKDTKVRFLYYRKGELWYEVLKEDIVANMSDKYNNTNKWDSIFTFPVPIEDTGDGQFNAEDKAILFMRYIRKELENRKASENG